MINIASEDAIQISLALWLNHKYPNLLWWHTPSGGMRNKAEAFKLKRMGVIPGVPDLFFPHLKLFIELKTQKGVVSKSQKEVMKRLEVVGYTCKVAKGYEEAKQIVLDIMAKIDNN